MAWIQRFTRLWRHRWAEGQVQATFAPEVLMQLEQRIARSEQQHSGQVQLCIEGGLPYSYIWREASARERAIGLFGKLRTWDTEHNNGVLIYLLMAEHAIEIVADRALTRAVPEAVWQDLTRAMSTAFQQGQFTHGIEQAIDQVTELLVQHFPASHDHPPMDNLPNTPVVQGRFSKDR